MQQKIQNETNKYKMQRKIQNETTNKTEAIKHKK